MGRRCHQWHVLVLLLGGVVHGVASLVSKGLLPYPMCVRMHHWTHTHREGLGVGLYS